MISGHASQPENDPEYVLREALLLHQRGDDAEALRLLTRLHRTTPNCPEADALYQRILTDQAVRKATEDKRRELRFALGLHTSLRRIGWGIVAIVLTVYALLGLPDRVVYAFANGPTAPLTTQVTTSSRYAPPRLTDYTRPVWYDLLYYAAFLLIGSGMLWVLAVVWKNVAQWEELEDISDK